MEPVYLKFDPHTTDAEADPVDLEDIKSFHNWVSVGAENGLTVAVVDSGIDDTHPVFEGIEIEHHNMTGQKLTKRDSVGHATSVASIIAQLAPVKKLIDVRIFGRNGKTSGEVLMAAYDLLMQKADEIDLANFSLGTARKVDAIDARHNQLVAKGVRTISASGNSSSDSGSPATAQRAFSAGALTPEGEMTDFSSFSPEYGTPSICALGKNIKLARAEGTSMGQVLDDRWVMASGTSFACPILLSAVANYMAVHGQFDRQDFTGTAEEIAESPRDGRGVLDTEEAIEIARADKPDAENTIATRMGVQVYGNKNLAWFHDRVFEAGTYSVEIKGNKMSIKD